MTKLGLIAPFEGRQRAIGYEALYAVKLALREQNAAGGVAGWSVELVALDAGDQLTQTLRQARTLGVDSDVVYALGVVERNTRAQVQAAFAQQALPISLVDKAQSDGLPPDSSFVERYRTLSGGITPGALALRTYAATQAALSHIEGYIRAQGRPAR